MRSARFVIIVWSVVAAAFVGGFLIAQTSGLLGRAPLTSTTAVAIVNGHEVRYTDYMQRAQSEVQAEQQRQGRTLDQDDVHRIENQTFEQMVTDILLQDEYRRRGIVVTDDELREYARYAPPPTLQRAPELQTEGRFDLVKYQRFLGSSAAREQGVLAYLEQYYRSEIPRQKLLDQLTSALYVTDAELWRGWQDAHDSVQVSFVALRPRPDTTLERTISDADARAYFEKHKGSFARQGRAVLSVIVLPRVVTAADSARARARALQLREEIVSGRSKFEDVAKRESADSASAASGGDLGKGGRGRFVPAFEAAAYGLKIGEISQPVLTPFGLHLIRVDEHEGDTLALRHILIKIQPSDSESTRIDRVADSLANIAGSSEQGAKLDSAARRLNRPVQRVIALEDQPAQLGGRTIPSVSAWAFGGAKPGETSELFDDENGYYLARLDSLMAGGKPTFDNARADVRFRLMMDRQIGSLVPQADAVAAAAASTTLEAAANAHHLQVVHTPMFSRGSNVPGLGQLNAAIGTAFGLPEGAIGAPVKTDDGVFIIRVDRRVKADSTKFEAQKAQQRGVRLQQLRQQTVQMFMLDLRQSAKIQDRRKDINALARRTGS